MRGRGDLADTLLMLRDRGDLADTLLMYASDQGFFLGDHGWFDKRFMYEESLRMPLLVSCPRRVAAGQVHTGITTNVDFARTILEAAGVPAHPRMQGRRFLADITGAADGPPPAKGMYCRYWEHDDIFHKAPAHYGYRDEAYAQVREDMKVRLWRAQEALGDAPHPRQPRPAGFTERDRPRG